MKKYELKEFVRKYILIPIMVLFLSLSSISSEALVLIAQDDEMPVEEIQETITEVKEEVEEVVTEEEPVVVETEETPLPEVMEETPLPEVTEEPVIEETPVPTEEPTPEPTPEPTVEPTVQPTPEVVEEVTETPEPTEVPKVIEEVTYPAFKQEKTIDDVTITVEAPEEVFPEGATLSVEKVARYVERKVNEAIDQVRDEEKNVAVSYTFDIKVLDKEGNEIQPKDMNKVKVSFKMVEVQNENLSTDVYHIDDKQEEITSEQVTPLESTTEEDVATVETDGFSLYTVEFTYNNKQYVLEGDTYVKLEEVLSYVELTGEVTSWEVSNPELFNIYLGDEDGIEYVENYAENGDLVEYYPIDKENGTIRYILSLQPFSTEEWLKVTIDGIEYTIVVTDAIRVDENGNQVGTNVRFMQESTAIGTITDSRVIQGPLEDNFTASMPLAEIYIDDTIVNQTLWSKDEYNGTRVIAELLVDNTQGKYAGFQINTDTSAISTDKGTLQNSYGGLWYDFTKRYLNDTQTLTVSGSSANNYELFSGDIVRYTLKGMATKFDVASNAYKNYDVVITYSDILITLCQNSGTGAVNQASISSILKLIDTNMVNFTWTGGFRAGLSYNVNVKVVDPDTGALIDGSYYYPMTDIDIGRTGIGGFANLYNASNLNRYSEQVALMSNYGRPTSSGSWEQKVWIPGGNYSAAPFTNKANVTEGNYPYTCNITSKTIDGQANTLLISPGGTTTAVSGKITTASGVDKDNTFYSGFITLANNTAGGINVKGYASAPTSGGVESYVLTGSQIVNHKVDASSDVGGTIFTTTTGNSDGSLSGGTLLGYNEVNKPFEISAATGQSVTYTMTPKGGYKLKRVWVKDGDIDIMTIVNTAKGTVSESTYDTDGDGELDETEKAAYEAAVQQAINTALSNDPNTREIAISSLTPLGKGVYAYTFAGIQEDKSIHIDWEKTDLTVTKELNPTMSGISDKFKFQIKLSDTSTEETTWRVRAKKNTGKISYHNPYFTEYVNTTYYFGYHEGHEETLPYSYVEVTETEDKNPYEEGWYIYYNGSYMPSYDTTVDESTTYYQRDDTQSSTVTNYYYHLLGWNESTNSWEEKVIPATSGITDGAVLGLENLDTELADYHRYNYDETVVNNENYYNEETGTYDKYLMWIPDTTTGKEMLVVGNTEEYPNGTAFAMGDYYAYIYQEGIENYSGKVIKGEPSYVDIDGERYRTNFGGTGYWYTQDDTMPIYYNLINNPNGYNLDSGYTPLEGESGMYIVTLPGGQTPNTSDLTADGWDVTVSRVGAIPDDFDLNKAMVDAGAKPVAGAVNTYEFELGVDETIDFNGVIPMGWNYEITEVLPDNSRWRLLSSSSNATINDFDGEEDVTFTNTEKTYNVTIEKQTVDNQPGAFGFTIEIYKETTTPGQNQTITIQAYKNSGDSNVTYKLTNSGNPIAIDINGVSTTIPTGEYTKGSGSPLDLVISNLLDMDNTSNVQITMNGDSGNVSTMAVTSVADQVQAMIDDGYTSFSLEPVTFTLRTPDIIDRVPYNPTTVPTGFTGSNGVFTCTLTYPSDAQKVFTDIPQGYKYEIRETTIPVGWKNVSKSNETGTLTNDVTSVWVNGQADYTLTVNKETVNNDTGSFTFKVKLWAETTATYMDLSADFGSPDSNGYYTFTLANGGTRQIIDIPTGYQYEVFEVDASGNEVPVGSNIGTTDWKLKTIDGDNTGTITDNTEITFTNELTHDLTIKKETVNNVEGTFNYELIIYGLENIFTADMGEGNNTYRPLSNQVFKYVPGLEFANTVQYNDDPTYCVFEYYDDTEGRDYLSNNGSMAYSSDSFELHGGDQQWYVDPNQISADSQDLWPEALSADALTLKALRFYNIEADSYDYKVSYDTDKFNVNYLGYVNKFTLANGESKTISNIPHGYKYEVYEVDSEGNKVLVGGNIGTTDWKLKSIDGENTGTLSEDKEVTFTNELTHDLVIKKETVNDTSGQFNFTVRIWKDLSDTEAYAVYDSSNCTLTFFRDTPNKYENEQQIGTKTYFTDIESIPVVVNDSTAPNHFSKLILWQDSEFWDLKKVVIQDVIQPISTAYWFYDLPEATTFVGLEKLDTSKVTSMASMFAETPFAELDVSHFDTSNVTDMSLMFDGCDALETSLDVSHFDTSKVENMAGMLNGVSNLNTTLNIMNMPSEYNNMVRLVNGTLSLNYIDPVTSENIDTIIAASLDYTGVVNGGEGTFTPPTNADPYFNYEEIFTLSAGDSYTLPDIPDGYKYEVYEETQDGWKLVDIDGSDPTVSKGAGGTSGTLNEDVEHTFNNIPVYDITVNKTVTGIKGDKNKEFEFTVKVEGWKTIYKDKVASTDAYQAWLENKDNKNELVIRNFMQQYSERNDNYVSKFTSEFGDGVYIITRFVKDGVPNPYIEGNSWGSPDTYYYNGYSAYHFRDDGAGYFDADSERMGGNGADVSTAMNWAGAKFASLEMFDYLDLTPYGGESNGDGTYTFKLKHGQHFTLEDIPYGYKYEVVEKDYSSEQYTTTVDGIETRTVNGTVTEDKTHEYINDKNFADLTIKKIVSGNMGDKYKEYEFEVKVSGWKTILKDKISNYFSNNDGAYMDLSEDHADDIIAIGGILPKYASKFRMLANGNICIEAGSDDFDALTYNEADGTITGYMMDISSNRIDFHEGSSGQSIYPKPQAGDIIELQYFEEMDLREYGGVAKVDDNHDGIADDGVYIFKLKHNGIINIPNIPGGYQYEVVENDYSGIGYITTVDGQLGREVKKTLTEDAEHEFENHLNAVIPTKAFGGLITPMIGMMLIAILWLVAKRTVWKDESDE